MGELFSAVLVANRGEIAVRIIRTLHDLGIASVAMYTDEEADAAHVAAASSAVRVPSYLDIEAIVAAGTAAGAQAVHPGYGFLAERAGFARACAEAGLVFIGPSPEAIETMGDKIAARAAVTARGVPTVPGVAEPGLDDAALVDGAQQVGFPVLIKPAAGGGGKGMHRVEKAEDLPGALATARREAAGAFGDDTLFLERFVDSPRHIEVQILADAQGSTVHLGERECSLQRRHQKVIEEAPSPLLSDDQRERLGQAAIATARSVGYVGAGTVEFIVSAQAPDEPFFMEMNTRLQVEHPVTEEVTGIDLVAEQVRIAAGQPLRISQDQVRTDGHAIEARIYAEDPDAGFVPTGGRVLEVALPKGPGVRVDHALRAGTEISSSYDPMLAKVIAHAPTRAEALAKLDQALAETHILGIVTNTEFLRILLADADVAAGNLDTGLIERRGEALARPGPSDRDAAVAALARWHEVSAAAPADLWHAPSGWRLGGQAPFVVRFAGISAGGGSGDTSGDIGLSAGGGIGGQTGDGHTGGEVISGRAGDGDGRGGAAGGESIAVALTGSPTDARARVNGSEFSLSLGPDSVTIDGERLAVRWHSHGDSVWVSTPGGDREFVRYIPARRAGGGEQVPTLDSPMPGTVVAVMVADGEQVAAGDPVLAVEAMKMEHVLRAPGPGTVRLQVSTGQSVQRGQQLARVETEEDDD